ncbi:MAG: short-chain dehydrogenase [Rhodospirillaceae bacterium TMED8]|nr:short-chain dehydrogenase [Magnetovibrio sp.]OUT51597.1 MAG: short-chain dehydrogenase [Rhodospirillaceae bacterium TMED8]
MKLKDKIAVVTGGASGIGESICKAYSQEGAKVIIADINAEAASKLAQEIGSNSCSYEVDISNRSSVIKMAKQVTSEHGDINILVNNAGARIIKGFMQHSADDWDQMLAINLSGPFHCSQAFVPNLIRSGGGVIINLCSIASYIGRPNRCGYVAAKSGLIGLTRAMAIDLSLKKIRVNAISPGMIASPFNQSFAEAEETSDTWASENLIGRWGAPDDIAGAAVFLASDDSEFITGSDIKVEGGWLYGRARAGEVPMWDS